ncbi:hypothetical protein SHV42_16395 [Pseudomonas capeferrum]|uniref:hypothetical protein n=1 Tax=Pseudomonas capeferrum TaxID=1495066 RepID=UPI003978B915
MKMHVARLMLLGLFTFAAVGSASASQMKTPNAASPVAAPAESPWPSVASLAGEHSAPLLAHDDRYRHDDRWHDHRGDWRRDQWRREQARREAERRRDWERWRDWERHHERAMRHRYQDDHRYYRR